MQGLGRAAVFHPETHLGTELPARSASSSNRFAVLCPRVASAIRHDAPAKLAGCTAPFRYDFHWSTIRSALFCSVPLLPRSASPAWEAEPMGVAVSLETVASGFFPRPLPPHATSRAGPRIRGLLAAAPLQKSRSLRSSAPLRPFGFKGAGRAQNGPLSQGMVPGESNTEIRQCLQSDWLPS